VISVLVAIFCLPLFVPIDNYGANDWDQQLFYYGSFLKSVIGYNQVPFWNPWYCGGSVLFQHPQIPMFSFTYFLAPFTGLLLAVKLTIAIHYGLAMLGMVLLARKVYGLSNMFSILLASACFVFASYFSLRVAVGHTFTLTVSYIPFIFLGYELYLSQKRVGWLIFGGAVFALVIWSAGIYPAPLMALFLSGYAILRAIIEKDTDPLRALILLGGYAVLFSAPKLIPVADYMREYPRIAMDREYIPPAAWFDIFFGREQSIFLDWTVPDIERPGHRAHLPAPAMQWNWWEYGSYIGIPLAFLFFLSAFGTRIRSENKSFRSRHVALLICWIGFFVLFVGDFAEINPYRILKRLPVFSSMHVTGRFLFILMFISSLVLMGFLQQLQLKYGSRQPYSYIVMLVCILIVGDVMSVNRKPLGEAFTIDSQVFERVKKGIVRGDASYQMIVDLPSYGSFSTMYAALSADVAILHGLTVQPQCYEPIHPQVGYELDKPLVFSPDSGLSISNLRFTPNKITFDLEAKTNGRVVLNQNFTRGWSVSGANSFVEEHQHKPLVSIAPGSYNDISFVFRPPSLWLGVALFLFGLLLASYHYQMDKRKQSNRARMVSI
jgi:hypothetical protein